jgi:CHRD domain-containing protein/PEP-CTERM motif-containing protein
MDLHRQFRLSGMRLISASLVLVAALLLLVSATQATPIHFAVNLSGANEVPPVSPAGTGQALVTLDPTAQTLQLNIVFSGLTSNTVAAHIHCCLPNPFQTGVNVGVATTVPAFPGFPIEPNGVTSFNYSSAVFDLTQAGSYNPAFVTLQGGLSQAEASFIAGVLTGRVYLNVHTVNNPGGEIRGFLFATPEPASLVLLGLGLVGFAWMQRRRKLNRQ